MGTFPHLIIYETEGKSQNGILIIGSDARGTAYGLMEISE